MREQSLNNGAASLLAELPVFAPDAGLWSRIRAEHERRRRMRRWRLALPFAAAAAIAVATVLVLPRNAPDTKLVQGMRESRNLEREWHALAPVSSTRSSAEVARLHVIDASLQAAYDRGAGNAELEALWQQRNDALRGLIVNSRAEAITRI